MFQNAHNVTVNGGSFTNLNEHTAMTGLQILYRGSSHGAAHDSVERAPTCHPETRKTIVADIMSWIEDRSRTSRILWFNGPAGAGKTAIAQTLCKLCAAKQWLAGSFFFARLALGRSDAISIFATIAYQLALAIPEVGKIIDEVVANDPSMTTKELEIQLQKLIIEPLEEVLELPTWPIVILIDGLDECESEEMQSNVLRLLGSVFQRPSVGGLAHICFIVTSRPEPWIRDEFTIEPLSLITRQMFLGQTAEANDDIRTYFHIGFAEIRDSPKHRLTMSNVAKPWPSYRVVDDLVERASGQFIYPATVLTFVADPNYRPTDRLDIITSIPVMAVSGSTQNPLAALDRLYSQILSMSSDKQRTLDILGALIAMQTTCQGPYLAWSPDADFLSVVERLLGLQPGDGPLALRMAHSLVHIAGRALVSDVPDDDLSPPEHLQNEDRIGFHHKSFIDYLVDPSRSLEYCVDMEQMNTRLALACMATMQTLSLRPTSRIACVTWGYAVLYWTRHVTASGLPRQILLQALVSFDIYACYVDPLGPQRMEEDCRNTIKRVAFPAKPATALARIAENVNSKKDTVDKKCPDSADIEAARAFLFLSGAKNDFVRNGCIQRLREVVKWMLKSPDSPPELMLLYQVLGDILSHYSVPPQFRPVMSDDDFRRNAHQKLAPPSIMSCTNMKELLKWRLRLSFMVSKVNMSLSPKFRRVGNDIESERKQITAKLREVELIWARRSLMILVLTVLTVWVVLRC